MTFVFLVTLFCGFDNYFLNFPLTFNDLYTLYPLVTSFYVWLFIVHFNIAFTQEMVDGKFN